jgi:hypothetical protein
MSHTSASDTVKLRLWIASGGRCEYPGCNKPLYRDDLTWTKMNRSNVAHIIADKATGPRGHPVLSKKLAGEFSNLMLLCYSHHHLIDHEGLEDHPVELLRALKAEHEQRIETVTEIQNRCKTDLFAYTARIGDFRPRITFPEAAAAVQANGKFSACSYLHELGRPDSQLTDLDARFWQEEEEHLRSVVRERVMPPYERGHLKDLSIFAIAPQPLLALLGHLLRDIATADVYQRHREPPGWVWQNHPEAFQYHIERPSKAKGMPALVLALSAPVANERVFAKIGADAAIWRIFVPRPDTDYLKSARQLRQFRDLIRPLLEEIKNQYPNGTRLNVFPAAPVSVCVELGRAVQPKPHMPLLLWDENKDLGGFVAVLEINASDGGEP